MMMASTFTGQPVSGTAAAIKIAAVIIAYSTASVSNARMVERRVKRDIFVPPSVSEPSEMARGTACKPGNLSRSEGKAQHHTSFPQVMIFARADHPFQEGLKVLNIAKAIFAHAERRS